MVSELIQDLEISVQISVFNLPKSLSFPRKKVSAKHFSIKFYKVSGQEFTFGTYFRGKPPGQTLRTIRFFSKIIVLVEFH